MASITVGNVEIVQLLDLSLGFPFANVFPDVSAEQWAPYFEQYPDSGESADLWRSNAQCYALRSGGETLLIDTGFGPGPFDFLGGATGNLVPDMRAQGIEPDSVGRVAFTHLHGDHVGWSVGADGAATFANARYVVPQADWDAFRGDANSPHVSAQIEPLEALGVMDLVSGEYALTDEITAVPTPGHTPGHQSFVIASAGERALILGDVIHHPAQTEETGWSPSFDSDGALSTETRTALLERLEADGDLVAACHFPAPGFGHIVRVEGKRTFRAL